MLKALILTFPSQRRRSKTKQRFGAENTLSSQRGTGYSLENSSSATDLNLSSVIESSRWKRGAGTLCLDFSEVSPFKSELQMLEGHHQGLWQTELCYLCTLPHEELQYWETPGHSHPNTLDCTFHKQQNNRNLSSVRSWSQVFATFLIATCKSINPNSACICRE